MNKKIIIPAILLILITISLFVYIFFFKTGITKEDTIHGDGSVSAGTTLPLDTTKDPSYDTGSTQTPSESSTEISNAGDIQKKRYTQLTTEPVAGMVFVSTSTVRYIKEGSGDIVDVDTNTNEIIRTLSFPGDTVLSGDFNKVGDRVLIKILEGEEVRWFVGFIANGATSIRGSFLPPNTTHAIFSGKNRIVYLKKTNTGAELHHYTTNTSSDIFILNTPFSDGRVVGTERLNDYYIQTVPSGYGFDYVYKVAGKTLSYVSEGGAGLTSLAYENGIILVSNTNNGLQAATIHKGNRISLDFFPKTDSCSDFFGKVTGYICAIPDSWENIEYPDSWYKGVTKFNDTLALFDPNNGVFSVISFPFAETGISFDIIQTKHSPYVDREYMLINKNNGYLWLFRDI